MYYSLVCAQIQLDEMHDIIEQARASVHVHVECGAVVYIDQNVTAWTQYNLRPLHEYHTKSTCMYMYSAALIYSYSQHIRNCD